MSRASRTAAGPATQLKREYSLKLSHLDSLDYSGVDTMHVNVKATILLEVAILVALARQRTSVTIDAPKIVAFHTELAWRHAGDVLQSGVFIFARLISVVMGAVIAVRTVTPKIMYIAHVYLLHPIDLDLVVLQGGIDSLAIAVARNGQSRGSGLRSRWG